MTNCGYCDKPTSNPKYCSLSCSGRSNGRTAPRRKLEGSCADCGILIRKSLKYCGKCFGEKSRINNTLGDYINRPGNKGKHPSWRFGEVRAFARTVNRKRPKSCQHCGYSTHIEYAHIKPLSSFPLTAKLSEVNGPENILILCRNHHWEFDHGLLNISDIGRLV